jgi:acetyl esterase
MIDAYAAALDLDYSSLVAAELRAANELSAPADAAPKIARIENRVIAGAAGPLPLRFYYPLGSGPFPMTLYFHGGGFVIGSPTMTDGICQSLAAGARSLVISPDYRLAPEAPFPQGLDDCREALRWAHAHAGEIGGVAEKIAVAGDSSGGNFAAVIAQMAREEGPRLRHQLLLYPVIDRNFDRASYREFAEGYLLTAELMRWFWRQYASEDARNDWRVSPIRQTNLSGVASATIITAEYDVLRDEAEDYAVKLRKAGVPTRLKRWDGHIHGFLLQQGTIDDAGAALAEAAHALKEAFAD